jgi:hypothetical protein
MRNRAYRRSKELSKYISRLKFHIHFALIKKMNEFKSPESIDELSKDRFFKRLKNGNLSFNVINKFDRKATNKLIRQFIKHNSKKLPNKYYKRIK